MCPLKRLLVLLVPLLLLFVACEPKPHQPTPDPELTHDQSAALWMINASRASHGLKPLAWSVTAGSKAQVWAEVMAADGYLRHSALAEGMGEVRWFAIGENVGRGGTIEQVHDAYLQSPGHKRNILGSWCCVGAGVARASNDTIYVVHVFFR